jgi:Dual specificity phosphatase, catalytic domain
LRLAFFFDRNFDLGTNENSVKRFHRVEWYRVQRCKSGCSLSALSSGKWERACAQKKTCLLMSNGDNALRRHANEIVDGVFLGSEDANLLASAEDLAEANIKLIVIPAYLGRPDSECQPRRDGIVYCQRRVLDLPGFNIANVLIECVERIKEAHENGGGVLVHCAQGVSRSASVVVAYVLASGQVASLDGAIHLVRSKRKQIDVTRFRDQLEQFASGQQSK